MSASENDSDDFEGGMFKKRGFPLADEQVKLKKDFKKAADEEDDDFMIQKVDKSADEEDYSL